MGIKLDILKGISINHLLDSDFSSSLFTKAFQQKKIKYAFSPDTKELIDVFPENLINHVCIKTYRSDSVYELFTLIFKQLKS